MALTLQTNARNAAAAAIGALANGGKISLLTASDVVVADLPLSATAFGAAAAGVITANAITSATAIAGTVTKYQLRTSANAPIVEGSVSLTAGAGDLKLANTVFAGGETVSISSFTYTMPAT